jgi:hypothetical protein
MRITLCACAAAAIFAGSVHADPKVSANPMLPAYGQPVQIELQDFGWMTYLPVTRYAIAGNAISIDYEYLSVGFGPFGPDFGVTPLEVGELAPGNYQVTARFRDIANPNDAPLVVSSSIAVVPPGPWGVYTVPVEPQARSATQAVVKSAAYVDPASMHASLSGNVVRVDFVYAAQPAGSPPPAEGMAMFGSVDLPGLAPGSYRLEGWGRTATGAPEKFFERAFVVAPTTPVVEYYSPALDHYFMALGADEIALLDRGAQGDWKRTGYGFKAWAKATDAPVGASAVCRFYARGPNSHFFTASRQECDGLKALEQQQRAEASAAGKPFLGWGYEGIAFYALMPKDGQCPAGTSAVHRAYNKRAAQNDSNHRFTVDSVQQVAMAISWADEGVQLCSPE